MTKTRLFFWLLLIASTVLLTFKASAQTRGGELRVGVESDFRGFDPIQARFMGISTLTAAVTLYDTLIAFADDGRIVPRLALSLSASADGKTWTAKLRPGVRFHDGTPFNAAAVAEHFKRILDPANRCPCRFFIAPIARVEAVDEHTALFHLKHPWAALPVILGEPSVVSLLGSPTAIAEQGAAYHRNPVGTGPFVFKEWRSGDRLVVERNEDYWDRGVPYLDKVTFRILPDQQARLASVIANDVDIIWILPGQAVLQAQNNTRVVVRRQVGSGARLLVLNTRVKPLDDVRVRRALAHALDMDAFVKAIYQDQAPKAVDPFGPTSRFACQDIGTPAYDPAKAKALLAEYGQPVKLEFIHTPTPRGRQTAQVFQQFWRSVGVEVQLTPLEQVQLLQRVLRGDYQIGPWRLRDSRDPDPDLFGLFFSESPFNVAGFRQPEVDQLIMTGRQATDHAEREQAYCALARLLHREVPVLFNTQNTYFAVSRPPVRGMALEGGFINVSRAWLER